jgi:hypothetical protein
MIMRVICVTFNDERGDERFMFRCIRRRVGFLVFRSCGGGGSSGMVDMGIF